MKYLSERIIIRPSESTDSEESVPSTLELEATAPEKIGILYNKVYSRGVLLASYRVFPSMMRTVKGGEVKTEKAQPLEITPSFMSMVPKAGFEPAQALPTTPSR